MTVRRFLLVLVLLGLAAPVFAQSPWSGRGRISVSIGGEFGVTPIDESLVLTRYAEDAPLNATLPERGVPSFGVGVDVKLRGHLGLAAASTYLSTRGDARISADIPHPFDFDQPRAITGTAAVGHDELALHTGVLYLWRLSPRIEIAVSVGPSIFRVGQDLVRDVSFAEAYPYDTAEYIDAALIRVTAWKIGSNASADLTVAVVRGWGVGGEVRYSKAIVAQTVEGQAAGSVRVGGARVAAVLRRSW